MADVTAQVQNDLDTTRRLDLSQYAGDSITRIQCNPENHPTIDILPGGPLIGAAMPDGGGGTLAQAMFDIWAETDIGFTHINMHDGAVLDGGYTPTLTQKTANEAAAAALGFNRNVFNIRAIGGAKLTGADQININGRIQNSGGNAITIDYAKEVNIEGAEFDGIAGKWLGIEPVVDPLVDVLPMAVRVKRVSCNNVGNFDITTDAAFQGNVGSLPWTCDMDEVAVFDTWGRNKIAANWGVTIRRFQFVNSVPMTGNLYPAVTTQTTDFQWVNMLDGQVRNFGTQPAMDHRGTTAPGATSRVVIDNVKVEQCASVVVFDNATPTVKYGGLELGTGVAIANNPNQMIEYLNQPRPRGVNNGELWNYLQVP